MTTLTIELPDTLSQQAQQRGFSQQSLEQLVSNWVRSYFQDRDTKVVPATTSTAMTPEEETRAAIINSRIVESCEGKPYRYPTVLISSSLEGLIGILPDVGGDAVADTEMVYEED